MVRVPYGRLEVRTGDSGMNQYLATAAIIAAGLDGIDRELDPGAPHNVNFYALKPEEVSAMGVGGLPRNLQEAIDELAGLLGLAPEQVQASNAVLREYGNMSSATLPHVWKALLEDPAVPDATPIVSLAFGPGLTVSGAILQKCG